MAKIHDVAERAGVSPATVSRYLSGRTVRSADAIAEAVSALEYSPSAIARSLKSGVTRNIGVVVPDITNPFFASAVKGIERASRDQAYNIFLANSDESAERQSQILTTLVGLVDALILTPAIESAAVPEALASNEVPVVLLDREWGEDHGFDSVVVDNFGGANQVVRHLAQFGHQRVATIAGPLDSTPGRLRYEGFSAAAKSAGLDTDDRLIQQGDFSEISGYLGLKTLMGLERPPTAVFVANNLMAIGALRRARRPGCGFPRLAVRLLRRSGSQRSPGARYHDREPSHHRARGAGDVAAHRAPQRRCPQFGRGWCWKRDFQCGTQPVPFPAADQPLPRRARASKEDPHRRRDLD